MIATRDVDYLRQVLRLNPIEQPDEIAELRNARLAPQHQSITVRIPPENRETRQRELAQRIDNVRGHFWSLDEQTLQQELNQLEVEDFPYLSITVAGLRAVASRLNSFRRLQAHPHCFPEFFQAFCEAAIAAPRLSATLSERQRAIAFRGLAFPESRSPREFRRVAIVIQQEFPELEILQSSWLSEVGMQPRRVGLLREFIGEIGQTITFLAVRGLYYLIALAVIFLFFAIVRMFQ